MESAPKIENNHKIFKLMVEIQNSGFIKKFNEEDYLYWDKLKYKNDKYNTHEL